MANQTSYFFWLQKPTWNHKSQALNPGKTPIVQKQPSAVGWNAAGCSHLLETNKNYRFTYRRNKYVSNFLFVMPVFPFQLKLLKEWLMTKQNLWNLIEHLVHLGWFHIGCIVRLLECFIVVLRQKQTNKQQNKQTNKELPVNPSKTHFTSDLKSISIFCFFYL